jgi:AbrB family looped-hinge helix DNA binding protein
MTTTLTERGQVSVPAVLRRKLKLHAGQELIWTEVSSRECRIVIRPLSPRKPDPVAALGYGPRTLHRAPRKTAEWMKDLRRGEA